MSLRPIPFAGTQSPGSGTGPEMAHTAALADAMAIFCAIRCGVFGRRIVGNRVTNDALCLYLQLNETHDRVVKTHLTLFIFRFTLVVYSVARLYFMLL